MKRASGGVVLVRAELALDQDPAPGTIRASIDADCPAHGCGAGHGSEYPTGRYSIRRLAAGAATNIRMTVTLSWPDRRRGRAASRPSRTASMMTDEQLIADLDAADAASLGCADIIVQRDRAASSVPLMPNARFAQIFDLHPGCAVAAIDTDGGEPLVGLPNGGTMRFVHGPGGSDTVSSSACLGIRQACGELDMSTAVVCGSLVHVWMASGRQVGALDRMTIGMAVAGGPDCSWFSCRFDHVR